jgi:hypothetical protein
MAKRLVAFLFLASSAAWAGGHVVEQGAPVIPQAHLTEPEQVAAWLKENAGKADKSRSAEFFNAGEKARKQRRWGPAGKSFGGSVLHYPGPRELTEFAEIMLIFLGDVRRGDANPRSHVVKDLRYAERLHRSVLAADAVLHALTVEELQKARENADCLATYLQDQKEVATCKPLRLYGLIPE